MKQENWVADWKPLGSQGGWSSFKVGCMMLPEGPGCTFKSKTQVPQRAWEPRDPVNYFCIFRPHFWDLGIQSFPGTTSSLARHIKSVLGHINDRTVRPLFPRAIGLSLSDSWGSWLYHRLTCKVFCLLVTSADPRQHTENTTTSEATLMAA